MSFKLLDRVRMGVASAPGTGSVALGAASAAFQSFSAAGASNGDTFPYLIVDGNNWEFGVGTYSTTGPSVVRTTISQSSNSGSAVNFTANAIIMCTIRGEDVGAGTFAGLSDVLLSSLTNGQVPVYNSGAGKWENATLASGGANPPTLTTFSEQVLTSGVSVSTNYVAGKGLTIFRTDTGTNSDVAAFQGTAVPGTTPWSVTMQIRTINYGGISYCRVGMGLYDTSSTKGLVFGYANNNGNPVMTTFTLNAGLSGYGSHFSDYNIEQNTPIPEWFQILFDGTTYTFNFSYDGGTWVTLATMTAASYFTATHVGFISETYNSWSSPSKCGGVVLNYSVP